MEKSKIPMGSIVNDPNITSASQVDIMNMSRRLPVIILIDTSEPMRPYEQAIHDAVAAFYEATLNDPATGNAMELSIIAFNDRISILAPMCEIYKQEDRGSSLQFKCEGQRLIGLALRETLSQFESRKHMLRCAGVSSFAPFLILISDSCSYYTEECVKEEDLQALKESRQQIRELVSGEHLNVICVDVGNKRDQSLMCSLTGRGDTEQTEWVVSVNANREDLEKCFIDLSYLIRRFITAGRPFARNRETQI